MYPGKVPTLAGTLQTTFYLFLAGLEQFICNIVAARKTQPMYSLLVTTPSLDVIHELSGRMPEIHGTISSIMPAAAQSEQTMLNSISAVGFYVRGGLDSYGLPSIAIVKPLPK